MNILAADFAAVNLLETVAALDLAPAVADAEDWVWSDDHADAMSEEAEADAAYDRAIECGHWAW